MGSRSTRTSRALPLSCTLVAGACALACRPAGPSLPFTPSEANPICRNLDDLKTYRGRICRVTGIYAVQTFAGKGGTTLGEWPVLVLEDGSRVMIDSLWDQRRRPTAETVARLSGRLVEATGTIHTAPPKATPENFAFWCISPVLQLRLTGSP